MQAAPTQNGVIEKFYPVLNNKENCPIKGAIINITEQCEYDMSDPVLKNCISQVINFVCKDATEHLISSWEFRRIPGPLGCISIENMLATKRNRILPVLHYRLHCSYFISFPAVRTSLFMLHFYFLQSTVRLIHLIYHSPSGSYLYRG